ncbi:protein arginine N-methyltransferase 7 [Euwallacea similis]|uniref:protein arginine N-methyltransferase 7 n=1 Tax=Euwallacea similis TaxID=1736056 RepID=UPI003450F4ED
MFIKTFSKIYSQTFIQTKRKMSVFVQKVNPLTGSNDWVIQNEDYDYHQEVARSAFADMLHDRERNQLYEKALKTAIEKIHSMGKRANVLDIGTGTGLLSMMAAKNGADSIIACEAFKPMSECALNIIELNGFKDKIKVIPKRSTTLSVGCEGDLPEKCNILVTEVFDTELIGEGALSTFDHAHKHLLEKECIVIPDNATIFAQVVECPFAQNWNKLKDIYNDDLEILIKVPENIRKCPGSAAVHDIQLSQLPLSSFNPIIPPTPVLRFDWSGKTPFVFERSTIQTLTSLREGKAQMVFMWWELQMDINGEHILSCAPYWAHPKSKEKLTVEVPWRDHWMQAVYYLPQEVDVKQGQEIHLISCHDEYSLWFNFTTTLRITDLHYLSPVCECGLHVAFSRTRIGQLNDTKRYKKFLRILEENIDKDSCILFLSDSFHYGLVASKLGAKKLYFLDTNMICRKVLKEFIKHNKIDNAVILEDAKSLKNIDLNTVSIVFGEPYFTSTILPWDNLLFLYLRGSIRTVLNKNVKVFPKSCNVKAVAVNFENLNKIREPLGICEGFSMANFDHLISESSNLSDDNVEAQPLWEYPGIALSKETDIAQINLLEEHESVLETQGTINIELDQPCNGIALWVNWNLDDTAKGTISTGPTQPIVVGQKVHWDIYTRQGVCLFSAKQVKVLQFYFSFNFKEGNINFTYS